MAMTGVLRALIKELSFQKIRHCGESCSRTLAEVVVRMDLAAKGRKCCSSNKFNASTSTVASNTITELYRLRVLPAPLVVLFDMSINLNGIIEPYF
ncbi:hypothetical protein [Sinimarinibacterium sp. NLF-5-8]|uniref:hypothetical protein n=1 Tax=Sinimarinibacterium sp. NLF-5-8 TaxID=2698684 RepID=UPI00137B9424|nr:hypothetical protein [Sinimarinibacterium sp. NLF-5-8]QHS09950.1 hypothetical protein GT972_07215 [Sinimarinibacterium sp. NLF-5-8]